MLPRDHTSSLVIGLFSTKKVQSFQNNLHSADFLDHFH